MSRAGGGWNMRSRMFAAISVMVTVFAAMGMADAAVTVHQVSGTREITSVACGTATSCVGVGQTSAHQGSVTTVSSGTPGTTKSVSGTKALLGVACYRSTA